LEALRDFRSEDGIPRNVVAPRHVRHQRNVAVRAWCHQEPLVQPCKGWADIRPRVELVPGEIELGQRRLIELADLEPWQDAFEVLSMQDVELHEWPAARPHLLHARAIFPTPGRGELEPIQIVAERLEDLFALPRDTVSPIN